MGNTKEINNGLSAAVIIVITVIAGSLGYLYYQNSNTQTPQQNNQTVETLVQQKLPVISYQGQTGKTGLELLQERHEVKTEKFDFGEMVTSINGVKASKTKFWAFYVNGKLSDQGAGDYKTKDGDKIEWRLEDIK